MSSIIAIKSLIIAACNEAVTENQWDWIESAWKLLMKCNPIYGIFQSDRYQLIEKLFDIVSRVLRKTVLVANFYAQTSK